jgi:hypothetical protein
MRKIFILSIFIFHFNNTNAQRAGIMLGGGVNWYYGDMNDRIITHEKLLRPYISAGLLYRASNRFDLWLSYMHGKVAGADSLAVKYAVRKRNLHFTSVIDELSLNAGFRLLGDRRGKLRKVTPYIFTGIGGYHFKPVAEYGGEEFSLQPIGTEGQYIEEDDYPEPYELYQISVPAGLGAEISLSRSWKIRVEAAMHFLFTDYLDDLSSAYPDSASLAATPNGVAAVLLSNQVSADFPEKGTLRGSDRSNDSFVHAGVSILWMPSKDKAAGPKKKKRKANCPAYN